MQAFVQRVLKRVPGMTSEKGCCWLYNIAKQCSRGVIVEIGCLVGRSTICLAGGSNAGHKVKVYAVDPFNGGGGTPDPSWHDMSALGTPDPKYYINQGHSFNLFWNNVKKFKLEEIIQPIVDYSEPAHKRYSGDPIELLFIDGDHRYNYVKLDVTLWGQHLMSGGVIALDDFAMPGVKQVRKELIEGSPQYTNIRFKPCYHATKV